MVEYVLSADSWVPRVWKTCHDGTICEYRIITKLLTILSLYEREVIDIWQSRHVDTREFSYVACCLLQINVVWRIPEKKIHNTVYQICKTSNIIQGVPVSIQAKINKNLRNNNAF